MATDLIANTIPTVKQTTDDNIRLNQIVDSGVNIYGSREKIRANLVDLAKNYLKILEGDISRTSYLAYLIDTLSILTSNQIYYQSRIYNEFFLVSAELNESVQNLARWIGYSIPKAQCAEVNMVFTIPLTFSLQTVNFNFPKYFKCTADNGSVSFTIKGNDNSQNSLSKTSATVQFDIAELNKSDESGGRVVNNTILSVKDYNGYNRQVYLSEDRKSCSFILPFTQCEYEIQKFKIPESLIQNQFYSKQLNFNGQVAGLQVFVCSPSIGQTLVMRTDEEERMSNVETFDPSIKVQDSANQMCSFVEWKESASGIYTVSSTSMQYSWTGYYNKGIIGFGNGILGKQPPPGSLVICVLKLTKGADGNVISYSINRGDDLVVYLPYNQTTTISYHCTNTSAAYGGKDILSTSQLKSNAIVNLSTKNRLVSDYDYDNAQVVMENTTISECVPILKRSDIKINEITLYFLLTYTLNGLDEIIPFRSCELDIVNPEFKDGHLKINKNYEILVGKDKIPFVTLFNIDVDGNTRIATYEYTATHVTGVSTEIYSNSIYDMLKGSCYMDASTTQFDVDFGDTSVLRSENPLTITLYVNHVPNKIISNKNSLNYEWTINDFWLSDTVTSRRKFEITHFKAYCITKWGNFITYKDDANKYFADISTKLEEKDGVEYSEIKYNSFKWQLDSYTIVPEGKQRFEFQILCYAPKTNPQGEYYVKSDRTGKIFIGLSADCKTRLNDSQSLDKIVFEWKLLKTYYSDVIITQDLKDCMQSNITKDYLIKGNPNPEKTPVYHIHDVPAIYREYYDKAMSDTTNNFELNIIQKMLESSNYSSKRMLTDFTNIKFGDTYGPMTNLKYNEADYIVESRYVHTPWWHKQQGKSTSDNEFPEGVIPWKEYEKKAMPPETASNVYFIINGKLDDNDDPVSSYMGYIACRYVTIPDNNSDPLVTYTIIEPQVGTCIKVKDELDSFGSMQTCYWTGHEWKSVEDYSIPLKIKMKVYVDERKVSKSDQAIKESVVKVMSEYFSTKIGLQKNLDRSEIIKVCRSVEGIEYVDLLEPEFDIKFDYEVNDLTQEELLNFTPQYVGFRMITQTNTDFKNTTLDIEVVRD